MDPFAVESNGAVGRSPARVDGVEKVTGRALYLDDIQFPGQLWGRTVRSSVAHGLIKQVRFDQAFNWTGITRVTAKDIPGDNVIHLIEDDQPCLADGIVRHCEEPIALLACEDRERLEKALRHVHVEIEPLEPVLDPLRSSHVFKKLMIEHNLGALPAAFANAHRVIEGTYAVGYQEQMYIEPNAVCATPRDDGGMVIHGSMQCPFYVHRALQRLLKLDEGQLAVIQTVTGGGFGGKEEYPSMIACHAALLAREAGRPVKMVYRRDEDIAATTKRHPAIMKHRTAVSKDGRLLGCEIDIVMDGGAYCTLSPVVASRGILHAGGAYRWPACRIEARAVATHTPPNGAFRGFGVPQTIFAMEAQIEKIAVELGMDPFELRRKNAYVLGDETPTGQKLNWSVAAADVLDAAVARSQYAEKRPRFSREKNGRKRRGIGLSLALHGAGFTGAGEVKLKSRAGVELTSRGARVLSISTDIGQGTITIFAQMVAGELGIALDQVELAPPDSSRMPDSGPTVASRTCMVVGGTIAKAAQEMSRVLRAYAAGLHGASEKNVTCRGGVFYDGARKLASFPEIARRYLADHGELKVVEQYAQPPGIDWNEQSYTGDAYACFAWSGTAVEVVVDLDTGEVEVERVVVACDVGKAIHPVLCAGQVEGGVVQALGYALLEELVVADGRAQNTRMQNYIIPTSLDAPPIETILIENPYPYGPHGAKGVGELPMDGPAPAVAAAILNATGVLVPELPITPDRLLRLLEANQ
jgi:CO/xanthine dehydrogenase Mo-binding subunit